MQQLGLGLSNSSSSMTYSASRITSSNRTNPQTQRQCCCPPQTIVVSSHARAHLRPVHGKRLVADGQQLLDSCYQRAVAPHFHDVPFESFALRSE